MTTLLPARSDSWIPLFFPVFCARVVARNAPARTRLPAPRSADARACARRATVARLGPRPRCFQDAPVARSRVARKDEPEEIAGYHEEGARQIYAAFSARDLQSRETRTRLPSVCITC